MIDAPNPRVTIEKAEYDAMQRRIEELERRWNALPWEEIEELAEMLWDQGKEWSDAERQSHILLRDILKGREK